MKIKTLKIFLDNKNLLDISFTINNSLALVGQSGSGKSLTLKALLGMLPSSMKCNLEVESNFSLKDKKNISFVPQNSFTALSPLTKIRKQFFVSETKIKELFKKVDLNDDILDRFPPELSGGQLQRVVIAMALENEPKLMLLDEPTTALDPQTRVVILDMLRDLQAELGFKILFVTHDMYAAKNLCEDICVIKVGKIIEVGTMNDVILQPKQEYTKILIQANFTNREFRI
jgi:peptide/nickel transport system ATP-binding protein